MAEFETRIKSLDFTRWRDQMVHEWTEEAEPEDIDEMCPEELLAHGYLDHWTVDGYAVLWLQDYDREHYGVRRTHGPIFAPGAFS